MSIAQFAQQHIHTSAEALQQVIQVIQNIKSVQKYKICFLIPQNWNSEKEHILHHKGKLFFWLYEMKTQLKYYNFTKYSTPADDFEDSLSNKHHKSVFIEGKKCTYLNHSENCTNKGFSYHLFTNKTEYIRNYSISSETRNKSLGYCSIFQCHMKLW